jgi:hypothetical protein
MGRVPFDGDPVAFFLQFFEDLNRGNAECTIETLVSDIEMCYPMLEDKSSKTILCNLFQDKCLPAVIYIIVDSLKMPTHRIPLFCRVLRASIGLIPAAISLSSCEAFRAFLTIFDPARSFAKQVEPDEFKTMYNFDFKHAHFGGVFNEAIARDDLDFNQVDFIVTFVEKADNVWDREFRSLAIPAFLFGFVPFLINALVYPPDGPESPRLIKILSRAIPILAKNRSMEQVPETFVRLLRAARMHLPDRKLTEQFHDGCTLPEQWSIIWDRVRCESLDVGLVSLAEAGILPATVLVDLWRRFNAGSDDLEPVLVNVLIALQVKQPENWSEYALGTFQPPLIDPLMRAYPLIQRVRANDVKLAIFRSAIWEGLNSDGTLEPELNTAFHNFLQNPDGLNSEFVKLLIKYERLPHLWALAATLIRQRKIDVLFRKDTITSIVPLFQIAHPSRDFCEVLSALRQFGNLTSTDQTSIAKTLLNVFLTVDSLVDVDISLFIKEVVGWYDKGGSDYRWLGDTFVSHFKDPPTCETTRLCIFIRDFCRAYDEKPLTFQSHSAAVIPISCEQSGTERNSFTFQIRSRPDPLDECSLLIALGPYLPDPTWKYQLSLSPAGDVAKVAPLSYAPRLPSITFANDRAAMDSLIRAVEVETGPEVDLLNFLPTHPDFVSTSTKAIEFWGWVDSYWNQPIVLRYALRVVLWRCHCPKYATDYRDQMVERLNTYLRLVPGLDGVFLELLILLKLSLSDVFERRLLKQLQESPDTHVLEALPKLVGIHPTAELLWLLLNALSKVVSPELIDQLLLYMTDVKWSLDDGLRDGPLTLIRAIKLRADPAILRQFVTNVFGLDIANDVVPAADLLSRRE